MRRTFDPTSMAIDPVSGKLFVTDSTRHRVLRFASVAALASGAAAEAVFGQSNYTGSAPGTTPTSMNRPNGVAVDHFGNLYVADHLNNRVLRFGDASQRFSGASADTVLGQHDFYTGSVQTPGPVSTNAANFCACGPAGELYVSTGQRIRRFDNARLKYHGAPADGVLGSPDFTSTVPDEINGYTFTPFGMAVDETGRLWVSDAYHHRVLRWENAAAKLNGAHADGVLGQVGFTTAVNHGSASDGFDLAYLAAQPGGRLWVSDPAHHRVLRWEHAASRPPVPERMA